MSADVRWAFLPGALLSGKMSGFQLQSDTNVRLKLTIGQECPTSNLSAHRVRHQEFADTLFYE